MKLSGLLIAAGLSERMGAFKPLLPYNRNTFIVTITEKLLTVCENVLIVTGFRNLEIESTIQFAFRDAVLFPRVELIYNPEFEKGMFTSLQAGIKELKNSEWIFYHFVDQPQHKIRFYREMAGQIEAGFDWIQPVFNRKEGHPLIFNNLVAKKISESDCCSKLDEIKNLPGVRKKNWNCRYPEILKDFDTQNDLKSSRL
jgi:molybdenum cofactor cytidylyltransferase